MSLRKPLFHVYQNIRNGVKTVQTHIVICIIIIYLTTRSNSTNTTVWLCVKLQQFYAETENGPGSSEIKNNSVFRAHASAGFRIT